MSSARSSDVAFTVFVGATQEHEERTWKTPGDKANLIVLPGSRRRRVYRQSRGIPVEDDPEPRPAQHRDVPFLNPDGIKKRGFAPGDHLDVRTLSSDGMERPVRGFKVISYRMPDV